MHPADRADIIKQLATAQGFDRVGISPAQPLQRDAYVHRWLASGMAGTMDYLQHHAHKRVDPQQWMPGAKCVIVTALNYQQPAPTPTGSAARGRVARYAWGDDYHEVIKRKLWKVVQGMRERFAEPFEARPCVDTAPIIEREFAMLAGVGWIGKNTLVMHPGLGSYFFLGEIVTTLELPADAPATDHCGSCTRCLDACPTQAFPHPYQMDARRCIAYHTIELREDIPQEFHAPMGHWIFGCDICQEVCPYNDGSPPTTEPQFTIRSPGPHPVLEEILLWQQQDYRRELKNSAMKRAKLKMLQRNAGIALRNQGADGPADTCGPHEPSPGP